MANFVLIDKLRPQAPLWLTCLFGMAYFFGAELGHWLSFQEPGFATFWPPCGIYLGALLLAPAHWRWLVLASFPANFASDVLFHGKSVGISCMFWVANSLSAVGSAAILRRIVGPHLSLADVRGLVGLLGVSAIGPLISATFGATTLYLATGIDNPMTAWIMWWSADALGLILVTPVIVAWGQPDPRANGAPGPTRGIVELLLACTVMLLVSYQVFHQSPDSLLPGGRFPYAVVLPVLLWSAIRCQLRGAALVILLMALMLVWHVTRGHGVINRESETVLERVLLVQAFLAVASTTTLPLAGSVERRDRAELQLRAGLEALSRSEIELRNQRNVLQSILDSIGEAVVVVDAQGQFTQFNPAAVKIHQRGPKAVPLDRLAETYDVYLPDGVTVCPTDRLPLTRALRGESCTGVLLVIRRRTDGKVVNISATGRPIYAADGSVSGAVVVYADITPLCESEQNQIRLIQRLQQALREIKTLRGLVPICASCKKIRNDQGYWQSVESYVSAHTEAEFTHGICPPCGESLYGDLWQKAIGETGEGGAA